MAAVTESPPPPKRPRLDPTGATAAAAAATTVPAQAIPGAGTATGAGTAAAGDDVVMEDDGSAAIVLPTGDPTFPRSAPATGAGSSVAQGTPISRAGGSSDPTSGAAGASASGSLPRSSSSASLQRSLYAHKRAAARKKALQAVLPGASPQVDLTPPIQRFADMGGIESCIKDVVELVEYPLTHPEVFKYLGTSPPPPPPCTVICLGVCLLCLVCPPVFRVCHKLRLDPDVVSFCSSTCAVVPPPRLMLYPWSVQVSTHPLVFFCMDPADVARPCWEGQSRGNWVWRSSMSRHHS